jgi:N-acetylmuramoyl-L-alanine amidase
VRDVQAALVRYGYGLETTGVFDERTEAVVSAFQRHFRPRLFDGIADGETQAILRALIETLDAVA